MFNLRFLLLSLLITAFSAVSFAQVRISSAGPAAPAILPVSEVTQGMNGVARTVFSGTKPEEFQVEILGIVPNYIGPKQDMIIGRLSGKLAERTFVFAGMSGSPVYVNGKLIGAISYSFPFAKEPIAGITPIEQMISTTATASEPHPRVARAYSIAQLSADRWSPEIIGLAKPQLASGFASSSPLSVIAGQTFIPISTPLAISGLSQKTVDLFAGELSQLGITAVAATGGGSAITPLKQPNDATLLGGDSVVVHLARGDIQLAAAGTVTMRDGEKIYAFGHPFYSLGSTDLPMSESHVITVVPNANNSFKLAVPDDMVGSMTQDRATGIYGKLGVAPKMIPVRIRLKTSRGQIEETNFETAVDETLTPLIINAGVANALQAHERSLGEATIEMTGLITVKGQQPIKIERKFAGLQASPLAAAAPAIPVGALLHANFDGLEISSVDIQMNAVDGSRVATVDRISLDGSDVRAGETIDGTAFIRDESGAITTQRFSIAVPKDVSPGIVTLQIADGGAVQEKNATQQFTPRNAADLISTINRIKRPDKLYAVLTRLSNGVVIGSEELPDLPPSVLATVNNERTSGGSKPTVQTILTERELPRGEYLVTGSQSVTLNVVR